ncbi:D-isomer specific 2-hydroxyacid dehydrogenase, NAD binding domain [Roseicitreum antarcticum]|uniref:D-isomer specific 2-hydroxyacid dehydrogenase, NAD binding domain n=1 Tax=Roseicitreum antarcticum TaxID=564137 RepID=A0A1H3ATC4_9RHOB|nr:D-isomer specific 2-hydroxyacid dehydrogenase, NAD binding domain [Roseicitreum antarcticum]
MHDPFVPHEMADEAGVHPVTLADLVAQSDIILPHAPATSDAPLMDAGCLATLKRGAVLINAARGALVDGRLPGAGLDVFRQEPPDPSNPLLGMANVFLSDRTAWYP